MKYYPTYSNYHKLKEKFLGFSRAYKCSVNTAVMLWNNKREKTSTWLGIREWPSTEVLGRPPFHTHQIGPPNFTPPIVRCSVAQSCLTLWPHGLQHARLPCPSPALKAYSDSRPLSQWCHPTISSSVVPFSSCLQSFLASGSFPMSQLFTSGGQSVRVSASASVLPMNRTDFL